MPNLVSMFVHVFLDGVIPACVWKMSRSSFGLLPPGQDPDWEQHRPGFRGRGRKVQLLLYSLTSHLSDQHLWSTVTLEYITQAVFGLGGGYHCCLRARRSGFKLGMRRSDIQYRNQSDSDLNSCIGYRKGIKQKKSDPHCLAALQRSVFFLWV